MMKNILLIVLSWMSFMGIKSLAEKTQQPKQKQAEEKPKDSNSGQKTTDPAKKQSALIPGAVPNMPPAKDKKK
jgi:hypothetical protein